MPHIPLNLGTLGAIALLCGYFAPRLFAKEKSCDGWDIVVAAAIMLTCLGFDPYGVARLIAGWHL